MLTFIVIIAVFVPLRTNYISLCNRKLETKEVFL